MLTPEEVTASTLNDKKIFLETMGKDLADYNLPTLSLNKTIKSTFSKKILDEMVVVTPAEDDQAENLLNTDQPVAFEKIMDRVSSARGGVCAPPGRSRWYWKNIFLSCTTCSCKICKTYRAVSYTHLTLPTIYSV